MRGKQLRRRRQIGCRFDADDVAALGGKNGLHTHARLPQGRLRTDFTPSSLGWSSNHDNSRMSGRCSDSSHALITVVLRLPNEAIVITNFAMASSLGAS